jgi:hypothetical protein
MKVVCIDASTCVDVSDSLTEGKIYDAVFDIKDLYVVDDDDIVNHYFKNRFRDLNGKDLP